MTGTCAGSQAGHRRRFAAHIWRRPRCPRCRLSPPPAPLTAMPPDAAHCRERRKNATAAWRTAAVVVAAVLRERMMY